MAAYATNELIASSEFAKKFGSYLSQIKDQTVDKFAILKNNKVEAVLISKDDYEAMNDALKQIERNQFISSVEKGLDDIKHHRTKPIDTLWDELDD
jgi:PHD/YefM family antitoxin component YafN of YafNO toxin-antitoxin module